MQIGPDVDRLPTCAPDAGAADPEAPFVPIYARPGATRRFGLVCSDADHDPLTVRLGTPPARGALTTFTPGELRDDVWGTERSVDAVYGPADTSGEPDPFTVIAAAHGRTTETKLAIANADEQRWFRGLGCASDAPKTTAGTPGVARFSCTDDDGDDLMATVTRAPSTASPPRRCAPRRATAPTTSRSPGPRSRGSSGSTRSASASPTATACSST